CSPFQSMISASCAQHQSAPAASATSLLPLAVKADSPAPVRRRATPSESGVDCCHAVPNNSDPCSSVSWELVEALHRSTMPLPGSVSSLTPLIRMLPTTPADHRPSLKSPRTVSTCAALSCLATRADIMG